MELGSEFNISLSDLSVSENNTFTYFSKTGMNSLFFDSGRSALKYLLSRDVFMGEILLPEYICESVIKCFPQDRIRFYKITDRFIADVEDIRSKVSSNTGVIFLMHYFGAVQPADVLEGIKKISQEFDIRVIEDATHSIFSNAHTVGDHVIASLRKWMQIPDGGVLLSHESFQGSDIRKHTENSKTYGMILKDLFLNGELDCNPIYRKIFAESESRLDLQTDVLQISDLSDFIARCVDIPAMVEKRKKNYEYLRSLLSDKGIVPAVSIGDSDCPLVLPIRVPDRDNFRRYLMDNNIYCAVHWPRDVIMETEREQAVRNSQELISLPIDQRYGTEHMDYMADVIGSYGGDLLF